MATAIPELRVIPFEDGFRFEWTNIEAYERIRIRAFVRYYVPPTSIYGYETIADLTDVVGAPLALLGANQFNSLSSKNIVTDTLKQNSQGTGWGARLIVSFFEFAVRFGLEVTPVGGAPVFTPVRDQRRISQLLGAVDPGPTPAELVVPDPLSEAHKITGLQLEEACMQLIPARLKCDWEGALGRLMRAVGAVDNIKTESVRKIAEEIFSSTTELAVGELESEFYDLE